MRARLRTTVLTAILGVLAGCRSEPDTALTIAAAEGRVDEVEALLDGGAGVDVADGTGLTAVAWAARNGHAATLNALLSRGADPDGPAHSHVWPPLVQAVHHGHDEAAVVLMDAGADLGGRGGRKALLEAAPDLQLEDNLWGRYALSHARRKGCEELVALVERQESDTPEDRSPGRSETR